MSGSDDFEVLKKYGETSLDEDDKLKLKKQITPNDDEEKIDIRRWRETENYTGPTKSGISIPTKNVEAIKELNNILTSVLEDLEKEE